MPPSPGPSAAAPAAPGAPRRRSAPLSRAPWRALVLGVYLAASALTWRAASGRAHRVLATPLDRSVTLAPRASVRADVVIPAPAQYRFRLAFDRGFPGAARPFGDADVAVAWALRDARIGAAVVAGRGFAGPPDAYTGADYRVLGYWRLPPGRYRLAADVEAHGSAWVGRVAHLSAGRDPKSATDPAVIGDAQGVLIFRWPAALVVLAVAAVGWAATEPRPQSAAPRA